MLGRQMVRKVSRKTQELRQKYPVRKPKRFFVRESPGGLALSDLFEKDLFESRPDEEAIYRARRKGLLAGFGKHYRLIDLFCGAGGMTLGFTPEFGHRLRIIKGSGVMANSRVRSYAACRNRVDGGQSHGS